MDTTYFIGFNALGDLLCTTPVLRAYRRCNPHVYMMYIVQNATYCHVLDGNADIDLVIYNEHMHLHGLAGYSTEWLQSLPLDVRKLGTLYHFDMNQVCSCEANFHEHISRGFSKLLGIPIESPRPVVTVSAQEHQAARRFTTRPYVVLCMHSNANPPRGDGTALGRKDWPAQRWIEIAETVATWGHFEIVAVGAENNPRISHPLIRNLYGLPIKIVASLLMNAAAVLTLESGLGHLCHAVDAPAIVIYSDIVPREWAWPEGATRTTVLYGDPLSFSVRAVAAAIEETMRRGGSLA